MKNRGCNWGCLVFLEQIDFDSFQDYYLYRVPNSRTPHLVEVWGQAACPTPTFCHPYLADDIHRQ